MNKTQNTKQFNENSCSGEYSCLSVDLVFKRQFSYYLITIYVPGCMLVIVSWVCLLTICQIFKMIKSKLAPKSNQFKPVDLTSRSSQPIITNHSSPLLMIEVAGELLARPEGCAGEGGSRGHHPPHHVHSGHSWSMSTQCPPRSDLIVWLIANFCSDLLHQLCASPRRLYKSYWCLAGDTFGLHRK